MPINSIIMENSLILKFVIKKVGNFSTEASMVMKRILLVTIYVIIHASSCTAQVTDAFQGILPVTEQIMMRSLNGV